MLDVYVPEASDSFLFLVFVVLCGNIFQVSYLGLDRWSLRFYTSCVYVEERFATDTTSCRQARDLLAIRSYWIELGEKPTRP